MVDIEEVPGGRIMVWIRESGDVFGVTMLLDDGRGYSYTSEEGHTGFPSSYQPGQLLAWALERWPTGDLAADLASAVDRAVEAP
jgi:hypothetical protein